MQATTSASPACTARAARRSITTPLAPQSNVSRGLAVGEALEAPVLDGERRVPICGAASLQDDARHDFLVAHIVGLGDDRDLRDRRVCGKRGLDLERGDVLAGAAD